LKVFECGSVYELLAFRAFAHFPFISLSKSHVKIVVDVVTETKVCVAVKDSARRLRRGKSL
jgi:hypothetical protein